MARLMEVKVKNKEVYEELTGKKPKAVMKHTPEETEILLKAECIELTTLQKRILEKSQQQVEKKEQSVSKEALNLLKDPQFFNKCIKECQKKIAGEEKSIKAFGLGSCNRLVENAEATSGNYAANDKSGLGKDHVQKNTLKVFVPEQDLIIRTRISPTALTYWHNSRFEPEWNWSGKVLYLEDISESVLNCEVLKTFLSGGSEVTVTIKQMAVDVIINGKPTIHMSFANSNLNIEQVRRLLLIPADSSKEQTNRIKFFKALLSSVGKPIEANKAIQEAISALKRVKVVIPEDTALRIASKMPDNEIMRTNIGRFFDLMKQSCAFHQFQRKQDLEGNYIVEKQDYELAKDVFNYCFQEGAVPITKNQKLLLKVMEELEGGAIPVPEIEAKVTFLSKPALYTNLNMLADAGFLQKCELEKNFGSEERPVTRNVLAYANIKTVESAKLPDWNELISGDLTLQALQGQQTLQALQALQGSELEKQTKNNEKVSGSGGLLSLLSSLSQLSLNEKIAKLNEITPKTPKLALCDSCKEHTFCTSDSQKNWYCKDCFPKKAIL